MTIPQDNKQEQISIESITWGNLTWVNILKPTKREVAYLAQNYQFNQMDLDDCLSKTQRPKVDTYRDYDFWVLHFPIYNRMKRIATNTQISVFIGEKYIVTLHEGEVKPLVRLFQECKDQEVSRQKNFSNGSTYLFYRILDGAVDAYFPILDKILSLLEDTEDRVFDENIDVAMEISTLRRDVITQRRISFPMRSLIAEMDNKLKRFANIDMSVYFGDLLDHVNKICETLDECNEVIEVFKDADHILSTERLNRIMRTLTIISTIMLPLIVLSGLWSMNVPLPFGANPGGSPYFFYIILAMLLIVVCGMLYLFHRKHWI
jgi:magnesium transporter